MNASSYENLRKFEIRVNILKILRHAYKQTKTNVTTYPNDGISWYTTWGKLLHLI